MNISILFRYDRCMRLRLVVIIIFWSLFAFNSTSIKRIAVIGGGAAGYFSAIECARVLSISKLSQPYEVIIFEASSEPLSKVKISGGGRCNVMHDPTKGYQQIAKGYPRGSKELLGPFSKQFGPDQTYQWFRSKGVILKTEEDGRVFPVTDSSLTIIETLEREARRLNVLVLTNSMVQNIELHSNTNNNNNSSSSSSSSDKKFKIVYRQSKGDTIDSKSITKVTQSSLDCDKVICATGSSRLTYKVLEKLGHVISEPLPSLFSFKTVDGYSVDLSGITVESVQLTIRLSSKMKENPILKSLLRPHLVSTYSQTGPLLYTHQGLSGPSVLRTSAYGAKLLHSLGYSFNISVNYLPNYSSDQVFDALMLEKKNHPTRLVIKAFPAHNLLQMDDIQVVANALPLVSRRLWLHLLYKAGIIDQPGEDIFHNRVTSSKQKKLATHSDVLVPVNEIVTNQNDLVWDRMSKSDIQKMVNQLLDANYEIQGRGQYKDEFVTCGGVNLKQVDFDHLESKVVPGLYLAGEVLDIDGITGGYNFQSAWSTGWIAGHHAASSLINYDSLSSE